MRSIARLAAAAARFAAFAALAACGSKGEPPPAPKKPVEIVRVERQVVPVLRQWTATLDGTESADVRAQVTGYVVERLYEEGAYVEEGAPLFKIDDRPYRQALANAEAQVARAEAEDIRAGAVAERQDAVAATGAFSLNDMAATRAAAEAATANVKAQQAIYREARIDVRWTTVRAPIAGVAGLRQVEIGDLVDPTVVLTRVATLDPMRASFSLSQAEYMEAADTLKGLTAPAGSGARSTALKGTLELLLPNGDVHPHPGRLDAMDLDIDASTGTIALRALFPNPNGLLRPGQFVEVRLRREAARGALVVPPRALTELQDLRQLAVVDREAGTVALRNVTVGAETSKGVIIEKGLREGDYVVVEGLQGLQSGDAVEARVVDEAEARDGSAEPPNGSAEPRNGSAEPPKAPGASH